MCLTEAHSGSDLGILRTKAEPLGDGSYAITGTKIFITAGEHDLTDNIVHLVLARLPDAPAGHQGHQPVRGAEVPAQRGRQPRRRQRRQVRLHRAQDGHPRLAHLRPALQRVEGLAGRQGERGPRLHVHHDEPRPPGRRPAGPRRLRTRLAGVHRLRQRPPAGPLAHRPEGARPSPPTRSSSTRTCAACCSRRRRWSRAAACCASSPVARSTART